MAPHALVDHVAREHLVGVAQQQLEQPLLGARELEQPLAAAGAERGEVELEVEVGELLAVLVAGGAAQQRAHAGVSSSSANGLTR